MTTSLGGTLHVDLEWALAGARRFTDGPTATDVVVVVDVLSFSTAVTVACERGARVWPHSGGEAAHELARSIEAVLAGTRSHRSGPSLSPASLVDLPEGTRLVLPSPNGSSISHVLMGSQALVLVGCLRNAAAVAKRVADHAQLLAGQREPGAAVRVGLVPAGERWGDGSLRVAYEDHVGAGAVAARLAQLCPDAELSPEARVAALAFEHSEGLAGTPSERELTEREFGRDVEIASQVDASSVVPVLRNGSFSAG